MTHEEAMTLALEKIAGALPAYIDGVAAREYLVVIHEALAKQEQGEPVAWDCCANCLRPEHEHNDGQCPKPFTTIWHAWDYDSPPDNTPQKQRKSLTDDEIWKNDDIMAANSGYGANFETLREVVRATEAAHNIKD